MYLKLRKIKANQGLKMLYFLELFSKLDYKQKYLRKRRFLNIIVIFT